jgi:hypothetical protein
VSNRIPAPHPGDADVFVDKLVRSGLLVHDAVVSAAVQGDVAGLSTRSVERRVGEGNGLTRGAIRQIRRAERAVTRPVGTRWQRHRPCLRISRLLIAGRAQIE